MDGPSSGRRATERVLLDVETLVARCRAGDALAWEALVRQLQGRVHGLALQYMRNPEDARDVAQEIFLRLWQRLDTYDGGERFVSWLLALGRNCCIDRLRRLKVRTPSASVGLEEGPEPASERPDPETDAARSSLRRRIDAALGRIGAASREMIVLHEIHELKLEEIAGLLSLPVGTVKSRAHRARLELARELCDLDPRVGSR